MHRFRFLRLLFGLASLLLLLGGSYGSAQQQHQALSLPGSPDLTVISQAITLGARYLDRACGPDGRFVYLVNLRSGVQAPSYNIVRHAGAIYALGMVNRTSPDQRVVDAMTRAANFLTKNYLGAGPRPGQSAIWLEPGSANSVAELGATGLGLVALKSVYDVKPAVVQLKTLQELGRFLLFLQKEDGEFVSKYRAQTGPVSDWESLYYPGEAALGLIALFEADHSQQWLDAAVKALVYLAKKRAGRPSVPADHWALIATAKLLPHCDGSPCSASRRTLIQHAVQICNSILSEQITDSSAAVAKGAFDVTARTAPAATRIEGLLAALKFLPEDYSELRARIVNSVESGIAFLVREQITSGSYSGGMPGSAFANARGGSEIRIDYVQHALSAWLLYQDFLRSTVKSIP